LFHDTFLDKVNCELNKQ